MFNSNLTLNDSEDPVDKVVAGLKRRNYIRYDARQVAIVVTPVTDSSDVNWLILNDPMSRNRHKMSVYIQYLAVGAGTLEENSRRWNEQLLNSLCSGAPQLQKAHYGMNLRS